MHSGLVSPLIFAEAADVCFRADPHTHTQKKGGEKSFVGAAREEKLRRRVNIKEKRVYNIRYCTVGALIFIYPAVMIKAFWKKGPNWPKWAR